MSGSDRRWIVFGASNVVFGRLEITRLARRRGVRDLVLCGGHGRSYGLETSVLGRRLSSLLECSLWTEARLLQSSGELEVVVTDVGNDLMYGVSVATTVDWVRQLTSRLPGSARITFVLPPRAIIERLSPLRFAVFRSLFFPGRRLAWADARGAVGELERQLRGLAAELCARSVTPSPAWYGVDPVHYRRTCRRQAWSEILADANGARRGPKRAAAFTLGERWRIRMARPVSWRLGRRLDLGRPQPLELGGGSSLWLL